MERQSFLSILFIMKWFKKYRKNPKIISLFDGFFERYLKE